MLWDAVTRRYPALRRRGAGPARDDTRPRIKVFTCTLFYSYFRLHAQLDTAPGVEASARLFMGEIAPMQQTVCRLSSDGRGCELVVDALVDPGRFPGDLRVEITIGDTAAVFTIDELLAEARHENVSSLADPFKAAIADWTAAHAPARPTLLQIGEPARREHFSDCDVTSFDIVPGPAVQVVGDAHELSRHFPSARFDFAHCVSVLEHLVMPWQAAVELNRVLKPGGVAHIVTHQTAGIHDMRSDFFRFSDASFAGLFNRYTGFEVIRTQMSNGMHIVPRAWSEHYRDNEDAVGFDCSEVIVRKIGEATVSWDVPVADILTTPNPRATN
jgi:SAM-dependent methyltransferase